MEFLFFTVVGFLAQLVDGALGMAYGVISNSLLLAFGYTPAAASSSVHLAEVATSGVSGHFHWRTGNVDRSLFRNLVWPGVVGGVIGALTLSWFSGEAFRPWVSAYLGAMGLRILYRAWTGRPHRVRPVRRIKLLGFFAGFLDAAGGGGWGPIVTTSLVGHGNEPRLAIGSANRAEFFVTLAQSFTFVMTIGVLHWQIAAGLCLGGVLAAPIAARTTKVIRAETLMVIVGSVVLALSVRTLVWSLW